MYKMSSTIPYDFFTWAAVVILGGVVRVGSK